MAYEAVATIMGASILSMAILSTTTKNELSKILLYIGVLFQTVIGLQMVSEIAGSEALADVVTLANLNYTFVLILSICIVIFIIIYYIIFVMGTLWPWSKNEMEKM